MDWVAWRNQAFDTMSRPVPVFLNVESTLVDLRANPSYIASKIHIIRQLAEAPEGVAGCVRRLRTSATYSSLPELMSKPDLFLLLASNVTDRLPDPDYLQKTLKEGAGGFPNPDGDYNCRGTDESSVIAVTLPNGEVLHVGLLERLKLVELAYLVKALSTARHHDLLDDRFMFELTSLAGEPRFLEAMPQKVKIYEVTNGTSIQVDGKHVTYQRFAINPYDLIRLCTVLRLITDIAFLQRLPEGPHLDSMAQEVGAGGRFPTPVLCIPSKDVSIDSGASRIVQTGGAPLTPYQWHVVDGQHRAFCYYLVDPAKAVQNIDVNCYTLANENDKAAVSSALFLDVNYKAIKPPIDLALSHHALALTWPQGGWVCQRKSSTCVRSDSQLYSSRILATRLLLEMNAKSSVFKEFFKLPGAKDPRKSSVQSLSTYLSPEFEMRDPADSSNPFAARFGTVKGANGMWRLADPPPEALRPFWQTLVNEFDDFLKAVTGPVDSAGVPVKADLLKTMVRRNINVFAALWRVFHAYRFKRAPDGSRYSWPIPVTRARVLMESLTNQQRRNRLYGKKNAFRSGAGVAKLSDLLTREFDAGRTSGEQPLAGAA
jgi:hypothetical protein